MSRTNEENAHILCEAIKGLAADPDKLNNFESYLIAHFHEWLLTHAGEPDKIADEFAQFAGMEWEKVRLAKAMNAEQFAKILWELKVDEVVEFGVEKTTREDESKPLEIYDVSDWWFAKRMQISGYESEFILVDYCGGGEATVIPVFCDMDEDDMAGDVKRVFSHIQSFEGFEIDEVYVDMGEQEVWA